MSKSNQPGQAHQKRTPKLDQEYGRVKDRERYDGHHLTHENKHAGQSYLEEHSLREDLKSQSQDANRVTVYIDGLPYHSPSAQLTGAQLRQLPTPPIDPGLDLFRVVSGEGDDVQVADDETIDVNMQDPRLGRHFFSDTVVPSKDKIARRAYFIYLEGGRQAGHDAENWLKAETEINSGT